MNRIPQPLIQVSYFFIAALAASCAVPPELAVLQPQYERAIEERVTSVYDAALLQLNSKYFEGVDRANADAKRAGDLQSVLAFEEELKRIIKKDPLPDNDEKAPAALRKLRAIYRLERAKLEAQRSTNKAAVLNPYLARLKQLERELTQASRVDEAKEIMDYREAVTAGVLVKTDKTPSGPTSAPAPDPVPMPTVTPVAAPPNGGAIVVASEMKAMGDTKDVIAGAISFNAPNGAEREQRGGRGILLITNPIAGKSGSTWSFRYTRVKNAKVVQIIHPFANGQVIIHLRTEGVGISTPQSWPDVGYGSGDTKRVKNGAAFDMIFPLNDREEYKITSQLDGQGGYELIVNGKSVATALVTTAHPLSLGNNGFQSDDLPHRWKAGYAAILLGPKHDSEKNAIHVCREIRFMPAVIK